MGKAKNVLLLALSFVIFACEEKAENELCEKRKLEFDQVMTDISEGYQTHSYGGLSESEFQLRAKEKKQSAIIRMKQVCPDWEEWKNNWYLRAK